jgi:protein-S-isoprenylcysteine O-methyltransferase Ste14
VSEDQLFRVVIAVGFLTVLAVGIPRRIKSAASKEPLDRRQEGLFILLTLRPIGLLLWAGVIAYLIDPGWMAWSSLPLPAKVRWMGVSIWALGLWLFSWTLSALGKNLTDTVVTRRDHTLVTQGPYRWIRHPFYCAVATFVLSLAILAANWFILAAGASVIALLAIRTRTEEAKLAERFGEPYRTYRERTGMFLPRWRS